MPKTEVKLSAKTPTRRIITTSDQESYFTQSNKI